jgi:hypothetical protein
MDLSAQLINEKPKAGADLVAPKRKTMARYHKDLKRIASPGGFDCPAVGNPTPPSDHTPLW